MSCIIKYITFIFITICFVPGIFAMTLSNALKLKISNATYSDETVIRYISGATIGFDSNYDAWKLFSHNVDVPEIYTMMDAISPLSINAYPDLSEDTQVKVFVTVGNIGAYTITATEIGAFDPCLDIFIEDIETGYLQDLRTYPTYTFNVSNVGIYSSNSEKFKIYFLLPTTLSDVNDLNKAKNDIYNSKRKVPITDSTRKKDYCELKEFTAKQINGRVYLNWLVISNIVNYYFLLEKSVDGKIFTIIQIKKGFVSPTSQGIAFSYLDQFYPNASITYRLKAIQPIKNGKMLFLYANGKNLFEGLENTIISIDNNIVNNKK